MKTVRIVASVALALWIASGSGCLKWGSTDPDPPESRAFVVENLGVQFGPWDPATNRAGDFLFLANHQKVFLEFGARVGDGQGGTKELPTFEYRIRKDAWVTAIADGRIARAVYQADTRDWEFTSASTADPDFQVGYDHVTDPWIQDGDTVAAGDTLGRPGTWDAELGRFEIMINNGRTGLSYCPFCFFDSTKVETVRNLVLHHMRDWESFKGDTTIWDERRQPFPGCRMESMVTY
jgi:hypothetical protein